MRQQVASSVVLPFFVTLISCALSLECPVSSARSNCDCVTPKRSGFFSFQSDDDAKIISCHGEAATDDVIRDFGQRLSRLNFCGETRKDELELVNELEESFGLRDNTKTTSVPISLVIERHCVVSKVIINETSLTLLNETIFGDFEARHLVITDNYKLTSIETSAFNQSKTSLLKLEISQSPVGEDAFSFAGSFVNLEELKLQLEGLYAIRRDTFDNRAFGKLKALDLRDNLISSIDDFSFFGMKNLRSLTLSGNNLHSISANMFSFAFPTESSANAKLFIHLDRNRLSSARIHEKAFATFLRPVWLNLSHNTLSTLDEATFGTFLFSDSRNVLDVQGNPLVCDSNANWILKHISYLNYSRGGEDEDVNTGFRVEIVGEMTFLYERKKPDYSYYKIRDMLCEDKRNIFARVY